MKKLLIAAAVAAATASVNAADFQLYGVVDTGFTYKHSSDADIDSFEMNTGNYAGSRFGVRGTEDLGDGLKVGFILENGFESDTGVLGNGGKMFGREAQLYVTGDWGTVGFGRTGAFTSSSSSLSWYWDMEPFEVAYADAGIQASQLNVWRLNSNAVYYTSPVYAGFKLGVLHSFTGETDAEEQRFDDNNTFTNVAVRWDGANAKAILGVEMERWGGKRLVNETPTGVEPDNSYNVKLAGAWTPNGGPATLFAGFSWYKNYSDFADGTKWDLASTDFDTSKGDQLEGYSFYLGGRYTIGKADLLASVQYLDGENKAALAGTEKDYSRYVGAVGCHYHFSNRTMLYAIASYADGKDLLETKENGAANRFAAHLGLTHFF